MVQKDPCFGLKGSKVRGLGTSIKTKGGKRAEKKEKWERSDFKQFFGKIFVRV